MKIQQAVLLVGGRGTRMWPLTSTVPKGLLPVAGIPFVELQLRQLRRVGIEEVLLAVGRHLLEQWEAFASSTPGVQLLVEDEPLDTAGAVTAGLDRLDERFMVLNGDVAIEADLTGFLEDARDDLAASLALVEVDDTSAYGVVVVEGGIVDEFVEKPPTEKAPARTVNAGMYVMTAAALSGYPAGSLSFERVVFPDLVAQRALGGSVIAGRWLDIGTPELYLDCTGALLHGESSLASFDSPHLMEGEVNGEALGRWNWVAPDAVVEAGASLEDSVILTGAVVESGSMVSSSVVGPGARIGAGAVVAGMTLVGSGAVVGAGCELDHGMRVAPGAELDPGTVTFRPPE